jgi:hypothetical protein
LNYDNLVDEMNYRIREVTGEEWYNGRFKTEVLSFL